MNDESGLESLPVEPPVPAGNGRPTDFDDAPSVPANLDVREAAFRWDFGHALDWLKLGHAVCRLGWNGKGPSSSRSPTGARR